MKPRQWLWSVLLILVPASVTAAVGLIVGMYLDTPLDSEFANTLLATLAQILASILAIVFSVSVLAVGIVSDRYTPRFFRYVTESKSASFVFFFYLFCITLFVIGMGIQNIPMFQGGFLATIWLFTFSLVLLPFFFDTNLQLLDPRNLADSIQKEASEALKKQNGSLLLSLITSLGDLARKALERGEDDIIERCLDNLGTLQQAIFTQDSKLSFLLDNMRDSDIVSASWGFGLRSPVIGQYYRIYESAIKSGNEEIASYITRLLNVSMAAVSQRKDTTESLKGILQQHQEFLKAAVEHKSRSRFPLVLALRSAMLPTDFSLTFVKNHLPLYQGALIYANRIVIEQGDMELWKEELKYFSSISSIENVHQRCKHDLRALLHEVLQAEAPINREKLLLLDSIDIQNPPVNWYLLDLALLIVDEIRQAIPATVDLVEKAKKKKITNSLLEWWATARLYDAFFTTCVYALYRKQIHYIKELWRHTNPPDAGGYSLNTNLVHFDTGFLTAQMVMHLAIPWDIEGHHGAEVYVRRYYLLCLAQTLRKPHDGDWHPQLPFFIGHMLEQNEPFTMLMSRYIGAIHTFFLNWPHHAKQAQEASATLHSTMDEWNDVFDNDALNALEKANDWLKDQRRKQEWEEITKNIIGRLPVDGKRADAYRDAALEYYRLHSQVHHLAMIEDYQAENDAEAKPIHYRQYHDKQQFTALGPEDPKQVEFIGFAAVASVVQEETACILKSILKSEEIKSFSVTRLTCNEITRAAKEISDIGCTPTTLLAPSRQIISVWHDDPDFRSHEVYDENNERYLKLNDSTKLRILETTENYIFILDKASGRWAKVKPLAIEVAERDNNPLEVEITSKETAVYQIVKPESIVVLKL